MEKFITNDKKIVCFLVLNKMVCITYVFLFLPIFFLLYKIDQENDILKVQIFFLFIKFKCSNWTFQLKLILNFQLKMILKLHSMSLNFVKISVNSMFLINFHYFNETFDRLCILFYSTNIHSYRLEIKELCYCLMQHFFFFRLVVIFNFFNSNTVYLIRFILNSISNLLNLFINFCWFFSFWFLWVCIDV